MSRQRIVLLLLAILLVGFSWLGVAVSRTGLVVRSLSPEACGEPCPPLLYIVPEGAQQIPGVLVAHGFAGSKQLMLGYGHVLAHAGYAVMLWDFNGHGANPTPLKRDLQQNLNAALKALLAQPEVDSNRLALLGHSMGSGAVMSAGIQNADQFAATIAISPTGAAVTPQAPRNLQLQAGSWEGGFISNAQRLLAAAGGTHANLSAGQGRELVIVPNVEHITILFSDVSHQAAVRWLDATFDQQNSSRYRDRRMLAYGLHLLGWLLLLNAIAPSLVNQPVPLKIPAWRRWVGLLLSPLVAGAGLTLLSQQIELESLGGIQVGGAIGVWFLIAGLVWLATLFRLPRLTLQSVGLGIALFVLFWVAFGAMAQVVWLQWWLIPIRLRLWLPLAIACFPWFLASAMVQQTAGTLERVAWWLGQSLVLIGGFVLALYFLPQLGFVYLLLPLFPLLIAVLSFAAASLRQPWSVAIASGLLFAWILAAGFPLSA